LFDALADRIRVKPVGGGSGGLLVHLDAHRDPLHLLGDVLVNRIVRETCEGLVVSAKNGLYIAYAQRRGGLLNGAE